MSLDCANCGEFFLHVMECPSEIVIYEGSNYCSEDCRNEHCELVECAYCEEIGPSEHSSDHYEGSTCCADCHSEMVYLMRDNHGDPNYEHRTY